MTDLTYQQFPNSEQNRSDLTALKRILKTAPQDLWLDTARRATSKMHNPLIHWMLAQPECDFSVAVHAFYRSNPVLRIGQGRPLPPRPDHTEIFAQTLLNWDKGFYRNHAIAVGPEDITSRATKRIRQKLMAWPKGALPFKVPSRFLSPSGGAPIDLPAHLNPNDAAHLWPLYNRLGLRVPAAAPGLPRRLARAKDLLDLVSFRTRRA
ncbi:hypothetical protein [Yoonia sediminilitoris]|uniref:DUF4274 domain-containing protein n=1 Tax=Yoonia sediminilitoris TaxID=1286148 RepID=A0A2T6KLE0_9RHOB|nr:hypothetical protein [Yoonia sediminilitoris]PUB17004.1 hypothetical protein C8N45_10214 [Yoonia sediminilitoris]RCW97299.1 hypothetical protein DFP92_10214 [Yoonia sediminilitoris]